MGGEKGGATSEMSHLPGAVHSRRAMVGSEFANNPTTQSHEVPSGPVDFKVHVHTQ